jgi:signal transduction histidine kinase
MHRVLDVARNALQASDRALQHARALLDPVLAPGMVDLAETADDAVACVGAQAQAAGVELQPELHPPAWVQAPRALLHDGLVHLLGKALRHSPRGGRVSLRVAADTGCTWHVRLADQGPGEARPGLVFGDRMARRLSGTVRAGNRPEGGALVELWLPAAAPPAP